MDYFEGRTDRLRPLGDFAFNLLRRTFQCEFSIAISVVVYREAIYNGHEKEIKRIADRLYNMRKLVEVPVEDEDIRQRKPDVIIIGDAHAMMNMLPEYCYMPFDIR